jgi:hypothetical protein
MGGDPVNLGVVASLARLGSKITGVYFFGQRDPNDANTERDAELFRDHAGAGLL